MPYVSCSKLATDQAAQDAAVAASQAVQDAAIAALNASQAAQDAAIAALQTAPAAVVTANQVQNGTFTPGVLIPAAQVTGFCPAVQACINTAVLPATQISGVIAAANLPAAIEEVLEFSALSAFPTTGAANIIYVAQDSNIIYRWTGTTYVATMGGSGGAGTVPASGVQAGNLGGAVIGTNAAGGHLAGNYPNPTLSPSGLTAAAAAAAVAVSDEGAALTPQVTSINFVGAGVAATNSGGAVTVTIAGGGGGLAAVVVSTPLAGDGTAGNPVKLSGGSANQVLQADGAGGYSWVTPASAGASVTMMRTVNYSQSAAYSGGVVTLLLSERRNSEFSYQAAAQVYAAAGTWLAKQIDVVTGSYIGADISVTASAGQASIPMLLLGSSGQLVNKQIQTLPNEIVFPELFHTIQLNYDGIVDENYSKRFEVYRNGVLYQTVTYAASYDYNYDPSSGGGP